MNRLLCRICDLLVPGCGMLLSGRSGVGAVALGTWGFTLVAVAAAVCLGGLHPLRAAVAAGVVFGTLQILVALEPLGSQWRPKAVLAGLLSLIALLAGGLVFGVGHHCSLVSIRDHCGFPGLLPKEVVLVRRSNPVRHPLRLGDLVCAATPKGPVIARVIAMAGDRVELRGGSVTRNDAVVPSTELGEVVFMKDVSHSPEETRALIVLEEELDAGKHPFFLRRGVVVAEQSWVVPEGHMVVLCDNRSSADALDSRDLGPLSLDAVIGRPGPIVWSRDPALGIRWSRFGAVWP